MNKHQQLLIAEFFQEIKEAEIAQDQIKQELVANRQFDQNKLFKDISQNTKTITPKLLAQFLQSKIRITGNDLYVIFGKFDHDLEGEVNLQTFKKQLSPLKKAAKTQKSNADPVMLFLRLIQEYIDRQRLLNICRKDFNSLIRYSAFDNIATELKGFIGKQEIQVFMNKNQLDIKGHQTDYLIHGLKRRSYFKVTLEAFCENIDPLEFGFYPKYVQAKQNQQKEDIRRKNRDQQEKLREMRQHQQKIQNQARKQRRRQQAQNQKQKAIQQELKKEAEKARQQSQRLLRKAVLESQKLQRLQIQQQKLALQDQIRQNQYQRQRIQQLRFMNDQEISSANHLDRNIRQNQLQISARRRLIHEQRAQMYKAELVNNINRENIQIGLRRDRCMSDIYSGQRLNYLDRDAQIERIRRQTALALAHRQPAFGFGHLGSERTHIYRPSSTYNRPSTYETPYKQTFNSTSKVRAESSSRHNLTNQKSNLVDPQPSASISQNRFRTPSDVRNEQLQRSRQDLDTKRKRLDDEIRTATGRKHPYT